MSAADKRKARGQVQVRTRTKPTTGNLGPRDQGAHGKTLDQRPRWIPPAQPSWTQLLFDKLRYQKGAR